MSSVFVLVAACATVGAVFLVWPYLAKSFYQLPLSEVVAGGHEPQEIWVLNTAGGELWEFGAFAALIFGPGTRQALGWLLCHVGLHHWLRGEISGVTYGACRRCMRLDWHRYDDP